MLTINELRKLIGTYLQPEQVEKVQRAYHFSAKAHEGQKRKSGEPYIHHPLEVAYILGEMHMDHQTLMAAILHDVIEDTPTAKTVISRRFGKGVAELVDGVSKLDKIQFENSAEAQAHNFRKMLMAMSNDIRVILVKLADRLHNMRTLEALNPKKRRRIARETLEVYAPIALRLGVNSIRLELEERGFATLYPMRYRILNEQINKARGHRKEIISKIRTALKRRMRQEKVPGQILGREKHLYGIYTKMKEQHLSFNDVYDVYAFRLIVDDIDTCYRTIGTVHNLYKPVPGKFKDYIAIPKANGYQSLHTVLFGPYGVPIEIQIRTKEIDDVAEAGIAAHWLYKAEGKSKKAIQRESDRSGAHRRAREWLRNIVELNKSAGNPVEFFENVKVDLFPDDVYVFTPKGKIMELPSGATAVDFAYAIHTDIGNRCVGTRINRKLFPLGTQLANGQTVEIITAKSGRPDPAWLNFVVTAKARTQIRHFLKNLQNSEAIALGKRLLNRELEPFAFTYQDINEKDMQYLFSENKVESEDELFQEIGLGNKFAPLIARQLIAFEKLTKQEDKSVKNDEKMPLSIKGTEGMVVSFPKCCYPIPGDPIYGFITSGRGIVVHRQSCKNIAEYQNQQEKWIHVEWESNIERDFKVKISMNASNQRGVLATVSSTISDAEANIENVEMTDRDDRYTTLRFIIEVQNRVHLANVMRRIRALKSISQITRN
ncbi:MAG: bifunctional GTP diphosphokinase/guanosine-3',5'-bis pyrophosphate 3'-pyrophosphohydrolase [Proteobacteria bacterium]|nr:guanosine-3',5'-bis(diphosphate) 3'-diphosphatase [Pseudomonadota bacterium]NOG61702.1 bifunctional GTP diphosphokinase/guanosine-3',5'-bis pyrophosphate 3'-pyrophosphohydrolase [Pseudomonadota bacterium]